MSARILKKCIQGGKAGPQKKRSKKRTRGEEAYRRHHPRQTQPQHRRRLLLPFRVLLLSVVEGFEWNFMKFFDIDALCSCFVLFCFVFALEGGERGCWMTVGGVSRSFSVVTFIPNLAYHKTPLTLAEFGFRSPPKDGLSHKREALHEHQTVQAYCAASTITLH